MCTLKVCFAIKALMVGLRYKPTV